MPQQVQHQPALPVLPPLAEPTPFQLAQLINPQPAQLVNPQLVAPLRTGVQIRPTLKYVPSRTIFFCFVID